MHAAIVGLRREYSLDDHLMVRRGEREISRHEEVVHRESYLVLGLQEFCRESWQRRIRCDGR